MLVTISGVNSDYEDSSSYNKTILPGLPYFRNRVLISLPANHNQAPYAEKPNNGIDACSRKWNMKDGVCVNDLKSENCDEYGGVDDEGGIVAVDSKNGKSNIYPEVQDARNYAWKYFRSSHFGLTCTGACAFFVYDLCGFKSNVTTESEIC